MSRREQIEEMLKESPEDTFLRYGLAMEHLSEGNEDAAVASLRDLQQQDPEYVATYLQLGQVLQRQGEEEAAKEVYAEGIKRAQQQGNEHAANEMATFMAMIS